MSAHIIRRLLLVIPTLFILSVLVFLSVRFIPGDAIDAMLGKTELMAAEVDRAALEDIRQSLRSAAAAVDERQLPLLTGT